MQDILFIKSIEESILRPPGQITRLIAHLLDALDVALEVVDLTRYPHRVILKVEADLLALSVID